jgi:hypothetical protein
MSGSTGSDTHVAVLRLAVLKRNPALREGIPAIGATHIGAQICKVPFGDAEHDGGREPAATNHDIVPLVRQLGGNRQSGSGSERSCRESEKRDNESHAVTLSDVPMLAKQDRDG